MKSVQSLFVITALLFCCAIYSCKKENSVANDFTWSGLAIVGDSIHFSANGGGSMHWDFGDSTTSTESKPYHIYHHSGSFTVKLLVNGNNAYRIDKTIGINNDPIYTHQIGGTRLWHHVYTLNRDGFPPATTNYSDTSFAVNYIDPLTISIGSNTLIFSGSDTTSLYFYHTYYDRYPDIISQSFDDLRFNYISNSIFFKKFVHISADGNSTEDYNTP